MDYGLASDEFLISLLAQGKKEALSALYDRYARMVFSLALAILRDRGAAEEVAQDTFLNLWRGAGGYRPEEGRVSSWILAIARHRAIDELRRRSHRIPSLDEAWTEEVSSNPTGERGDEILLTIQVKNALASLPLEQRQAIHLAYFAGLTQEEIAGVLGEPLGTVKARIRLGLKKLREAIAER